VSGTLSKKQMTETLMKIRPIEEYALTVETMYRFTVILILQFTHASDQIRETIIRNFIARGMICLQSILQLWVFGNTSDCWILYRALIDRLFCLRTLAEKDEFEKFEKWSFMQQYEALNRVRSDPIFSVKADKKSLAPTKENKERYLKLKKDNIQWIRPKAETVADKSFGMPYLYSYGYDYASMYVHPMANDGENDYLRIIQDKTSTKDHIVVVHNSILIQTMLIQEGLKASNFLWRAIVNNFLDQCRYSLETGSQDHLETFAKLINAGPKYVWYQQKPNNC
jgi:hypothetical protein